MKRILVVLDLTEEMAGKLHGMCPECCELWIQRITGHAINAIKHRPPWGKEEFDVIITHRHGVEVLSLISAAQNTGLPAERILMVGTKTVGEEEVAQATLEAQELRTGDCFASPEEALKLAIVLVAQAQA